MNGNIHIDLYVHMCVQTPLTTACQNSLPYHNSNSNADVSNCIDKWKDKENDGEIGSCDSPKLLFVEKVDAD